MSHSDLSAQILLISAGLVAGFIDSIAGGGGLITLPSLTFLVGPGAMAIGTNKIVGGLAALTALLIYARGGHLDLRNSFLFTLCVASASFVGSRLTPLIPIWMFWWLLVVTCPVILWIVWNREFWTRAELAEGAVRVRVPTSRVVFSGLACGLYDGMWGPGGGTFMFLALFLVAKMPLLSALTAAKLANTASAFSSLVGYALAGFVDWKQGLILGAAVTLGAVVGARLATKRAAKLVRPILALVVSLLLVRLMTE